MGGREEEDEERTCRVPVYLTVQREEGRGVAEEPELCKTL